MYWHDVLGADLCGRLCYFVTPASPFRYVLYRYQGGTPYKMTYPVSVTRGEIARVRGRAVDGGFLGELLIIECAFLEEWQRSKRCWTRVRNLPMGIPISCRGLSGRSEPPIRQYGKTLRFAFPYGGHCVIAPLRRHQ